MLYTVMRLLPKKVRQELIRRGVDVSGELDPRLTIKLAETRDEFEGAFRVLHDSYVQMGYCAPQASGIRLTFHHVLPSTSVVVAKLGDEVVGTLSLVRDNKLGLPMEKVWPLGFLRKQSARVAEITCLAIEPGFRRAAGSRVFFPLLKFMYEYCVKQFGTDYISVVVSPEHADFYEGLLFFERVDRVIVPDYLGAPAVALFLDLSRAPERFRRCYSNRKESQDLYTYFVHRRIEALRFPERKPYLVDSAPLSRELFNYFFVEKTELRREFTPEQLEKLGLHFPRTRPDRACRVPVEISARILIPETFASSLVRVRDLSRTGMRLIGASSALGRGREVLIELRPEEGHMLLVRAKVAWAHSDHGFGLFVVPGQTQWVNFVERLEKPMEELSGALFEVRKAS